MIWMFLLLTLVLFLFMALGLWVISLLAAPTLTLQFLVMLLSALMGLLSGFSLLRS